MKKQLFLLVLLLAFFAGTTNVNAQCVSDGFNPAAGVPYLYQVGISGPGYDGVGGTYDWYITQNVNILDAPSILTPADGFFTVDATAPWSTYHAAGATSNQINITWTPLAVAAPASFYLVLRYTEENSTSSPACSAENIRVWQIDPINTFLLAVEGANSDGTTFLDAEQCAAGVTGATITPDPDPTASTVNITYGNNTLYYRLTASGILGEWRPSIRIPALAGLNQNYVSVEWNTAADGSGTWNTFGVPAADEAGGDFTSTANATVTDATNGSTILIRIVIANVNYETLADQPVTVGVDGYLPTAYTVSDIWGPGVWPGTPDPCDEATEFAKEATYTILARPTITEGAGMDPFITKLP